MAILIRKTFLLDLLRRRYWLITILVTFMVWVALALSLWPLKDADGSFASNPYGLSTTLENKVLDLLFQLRDVTHPERRTQRLNEPITLIVIDEASIRASKVRLQKWPRDWYARLVNRASKGGAAVIGVDLLLSEEGGMTTEDKAADQQLAEAIASAGNVVLVAKLPAGGYDAVFPLPMFSEAAYSVGFADLPLDSDGFVRSVPLTISRPNEETKFSFATRLAEGYLASRVTEGKAPPFLRPVSEEMDVLGERQLPLRRDRYLQIDFRTRSPAFRRISAGQILFADKAQVPDDLFQGRIVIIGAANIDAPDLFYTSFYEASTLSRLLDRNLPTDPVRTPGSELHATAVATMLFGQTPTRPRYLWQIAILMLPLAVIALVVFRMRTSFGLLALLVVAVGALSVSSFAFNASGLILPLASAWAGMLVLIPLGFGLRLARERILTSEAEAERALVMDILSRCVSKSVAKELWHRRDKILSGERQIVTIIFTDIRGFTTIAETAASDQVVEWLNIYFNRMNTIVEKHRGHINKFIGDGIMIVFGAPASLGDAVEARAAVACGLEMLAEVQKLNQEWQGTGRPQIAIGVGIHTGDATCGVVGAERRLEYTIIGDTVNLASRLESTTKDYGIPILISDATAALLGDDYDVRALGDVKVKGKMTKSRIYTVSQKSQQEVKTPLAVA
jgi:adenylate cyclase